LEKLPIELGKILLVLSKTADTIQIGYGAVTNPSLKTFPGKSISVYILSSLGDGIVELMKKGAIDNTKKTINRGKSSTTFCMGHKDTYDFIHDNPDIEFRTIDYTIIHW